MTKDEAIKVALMSVSLSHDIQTAQSPATKWFETKLRELGYWVAPVEATDKMWKSMYGTLGKTPWQAMRDAFLSEES